MSLRTIVSTASAAALLLSGASDALAVKYGNLDRNGHPYVGLMLAMDANGNRWRCSGALLSSKLFLTAGHCTDGAASVEIWFDADVESGIPVNGYPAPGDPSGGKGDVSGKPFTHPDYNPAAFFYRDLGVVVLNTPWTLGEYATLPAANQLDSMATRRGKQDVTFTAVGYGLQFINPVFIQSERVRMFATPSLIQINVPGFTGDFSMLLSNNHSTGGTCFGDSGGPNFIGKSNVVGGVTSFGINGNCAGTGGVYRLDRDYNLNWLYEVFGDLIP